MEGRIDTAFNPLKSPMGAHVRKTTYVPLIDTALYIMLLMRVISLLGPRMALVYSNGSMQFNWAQKSLDFQGPTPSHLPS